MDLSKNQKTRRDAVEAPLFQLEKLLEELDEDECITRTDATMKVWHETSGTLEPALIKQRSMAKDLTDLQEKLKALWNQGFARKWKADK